MLERKSNNILDTLQRHREGIAREALADDDLDAAGVVARGPVTLTEKLRLERWKLEQC
jgi:hypothetical protein